MYKVKSLNPPDFEPLNSIFSGSLIFFKFNFILITLIYPTFKYFLFKPYLLIGCDFNKAIDIIEIKKKNSLIRDDWFLDKIIIEHGIKIYHFPIYNWILDKQIILEDKTLLPQNDNRKQRKYHIICTNIILNC